jgi:CRP/FNR family transcriptional regulator, anaerobic regulatory protein
MHADEYTPLQKFASRLIDFSECEWHAHRDLLRRRFLKKGEFLVQAGEVCNYVSFINCGSLRVFMEVDHQEINKHFFFEHEYASDYCSFLTRIPGRLNIKALENAELMELSYDSVQLLYERFPVWQKYGRLIAENLYIHVANRTQELLLRTPEEMYINLVENQSPIIARIPQHYIASYLGIQPESLSRIRKRIMEFKRA